MSWRPRGDQASRRSPRSSPRLGPPMPSGWNSTSTEPRNGPPTRRRHHDHHRFPTRHVDNGVNVEALLGAREALHPGPAGRPVHLHRRQRMGPGHPQPFDRRAVLRPRRGAEPPSALHRRHRPPRRSSPSEDNGPTPPEMVLIGLAGCLTAGVASVAQNRGIQLNSVRATVEGRLDVGGILGIDPESATASAASPSATRSTPTPPTAEIEAARRPVPEALRGVRRRHQPARRSSSTSSDPAAERRSGSHGTRHAPSTSS